MGKRRKYKRRLYMLIFLTFFACMGMKTTVHAQTVKRIKVSIGENESPGKKIQAALNEALKDQSGKVLYEINLPSGTYKLDALLKVFSNTTIKMNGCRLIRNYDATMLRLGYENVSSKGYSGQHNIVIEGGVFDGGAKNNGALIRMGHAKNITLKNVTFQNVYNSHHVEMAACKNVSIQKCTFKDYSCGSDITNSANNEALQFDVIHNGEHFNKYPPFDDTPCANVTVNKCVFKNLQRGIGTHSGVAGSYFTNMKFTNNVFENVRGYAIIATNYKNSVISNNKITKCGAGILFRSMVQGYNNFYTPLKKKVSIDKNAKSTISNNTISVSDYKYTTTAYGISLYGEKLTSKRKNAPKGDYTMTGVTVKNNSIVMNNCGYGIWLQGTNKCKVLKNKVTMNIKPSVSGKGNGDCIRLLNSKNAQIGNNVLAQKNNNKRTKEACGIVISKNSGATVISNKINKSSKDGVFVNGKSTATLRNNVIKGTGRYGINVCEKSKAVAKSNKLSSCKKAAMKTSTGGKIKK